MIPRSFQLEYLTMALELKPGATVRVTVNKAINRDAARKTLERLFMKDKAVAGPIAVRSDNFKEIPKRRGGCIWTKRPNKVHCDLSRGASATITTTTQSIKDLNSVASFVEVKNA
jgi:hypothetical protein